MFLEVILSLIALVFSWDYFYKKHRNEVLEKSGIKGPKPVPILGNFLDIQNVNTENILEIAQDFKRKYGKVCRFWFLHQVNVFIMDIKYLENIFNCRQLTHKGNVYDFLTDWIGEGLNFSWGKKWHARRKIITPTFHFKILEQFVEIFDQQSTIMMGKLAQKADGNTAIDMYPFLCLCGLDIITETAMGVKMNAQENPDLEYIQALARLTHIAANRMLQPLQRTKLLFRLTAPKLYRETEQCVEVLQKFTIDVIEKKRETLERNTTHINTPENEEEDPTTKKRLALLDVLLQSTIEGKPLTNDEIREEVDTFIAGGHETTANAIGFTLYLIARYPKVQEKLLEEIKEVMGKDKNQNITYPELQDLKYLECVIKESLRLYPTVPLISRLTTEDIAIGDLLIPSNTNISLPFFMVFRDPNYFSQPNDFLPERFARDSQEKINTFAYTPFSAGPRNCIGQKFALLSMKSTISKTLRYYELLPLGPDVKPMINIVLRSGTGMHVGLRPRNLSESQ